MGAMNRTVAAGAICVLASVSACLGQELTQFADPWSAGGSSGGPGWDDEQERPPSEPVPEEPRPDRDTGPDGSDTDSGACFVCDDWDGGGVDIECDVWEQNCDDGEKCMPWANDGGAAWNAARCTPIPPQADRPGEPCTVEGGWVLGVDTCVESAMCWAVDPATGRGTCVSFCEGSLESPTCSDPQRTCTTVNGPEVLPLCLPTCNPILQDCPDARGCYAGSAGFVCVPDASGSSRGAYADECDFRNGCDPGLWCAGADAVPACESYGCCSAYCDLRDAKCPGVGQECFAYYADEGAPLGQEYLGLCALPGSSPLETPRMFRMPEG